MEKKKFSEGLSKLILEVQELAKDNPGVLSQLNASQLTSFKELTKEDLKKFVEELEQNQSGKDSN